MDTFKLKGFFSAEKAKVLISSIDKLSSIGVEKFILNFKVEDDIKKMFIFTMNSNTSILSRLYFDSSLLDGFDFTSDIKFGITKIKELTSILQLFKDGFTITIYDKHMVIEHDNGQFEFYGADITRIKEGTSKELELQKLASIKASDLGNFIRAIDKLEYKHILFKSNKQKNVLNVSIADKDIKGNSFSKNIPCEFDNDFKIIINKDNFSNIINDKVNIEIYKQVIKIFSSGNFLKEEYYITTLV